MRTALFHFYDIHPQPDKHRGLEAAGRRPQGRRCLPGQRSSSPPASTSSCARPCAAPRAFPRRRRCALPGPPNLRYLASIQLALRRLARAWVVSSTNRRQRTITKVGKSDCERTFAKTSGNDEVAPKAVPPCDGNHHAGVIGFVGTPRAKMTVIPFGQVVHRGPKPADGGAQFSPTKIQ